MLGRLMRLIVVAGCFLTACPTEEKAASADAGSGANVPPVVVADAGAEPADGGSELDGGMSDAGDSDAGALDSGMLDAGSAPAKKSKKKAK